MSRKLAAIAALALVLTGCDSGAPVTQPPQPPPSVTPAPTPSATPSAAPTSSPPSPSPVTKVSANKKDCYDGDCILRLTKPTRIPLNAKKLHYSAMRVTAVSTESLSYTVAYPGGGGVQASVGPGGASTFGFREFPTITVSLTVVGGKPALVLKRGPAA